MTKDTWRTAALRKKYGPVRYEKEEKAGLDKRKTSPKKAKPKRTKRNHPNAWNENSKLWFGKHKNKAISEVPLAYLIWVAYELEHPTWRIANLRDFLREYLRRGRKK